ncbi:DUF2800 domain-containing protein [Heliophilum fasciatum]|uniref:Uncharacterized protein DUF2800 n=1 Tax=Heliophilum fasciatum TaxID=35700 RepID=A0A4R2RNZ1_9FIRM|nr:DUF2800 domain-containing protein [Heliophilum fasciatum]MCW2277757.1 hypothetical protein [Heliophilum fasciatum]TCP64748.1 uncharacterized protein DUF2800 [Heliophilum fasciatum]
MTSAPTTVASQPAHALLSASSSHRWLHCTPSARLEQQFPDSTSTFAAEGSLAHEIAELKLRKKFVEPIGPRTFSNRLKKLQENPLYQSEMLKHTDTYVDYISGIVHSFVQPPYVAVEKRIDYSAYVPEGFGTSDCIIIGGNVMHVIDLKYGTGVPVSAQQNTQMMLYALGALGAYGFLYPIETVKIAIVQPRRDSIGEWEISVADLLAWGESIKPIAAKAFAGEGEYIPGSHCKFCRAKAQCRARAEYNLQLDGFEKKMPPLITNDEVGAILAKAQDLAKWAEDLKEYALAECLKGNEIPGWKAVEGRGHRAFVDIDAAFATVKQAGYDEAMLYERKPLSVKGVEDLLGKAKFKELLNGYVNTPPGKPALAPVSDKRSAVTLKSNAAEDFS